MAHSDTFVVTTVDSSGDVGQYPSIAIDASGNPHIGYYDASNFDLKYAHRDGETWQVEVAQGAGFVGNGLSIALDAQGRPHISYRDDGVDSLKYTWKTGETWGVESVVGSRYFQNISMRLDPQNTPHIAYFDYGPRLRYATRLGPAWYTETVDTLLAWTSLQLDASGRPCIAAAALTIKYLCKSKMGWSADVLAGLEGTSLCFDPDGNPHMSYTAQEGVIHAWKIAGTWTTEVASDANPRGATSLGIDLNGRPHICYATGTRLEYATKVQGNWVIQVVDQIGLAQSVTGDPVLALDGAGNVHIAYRVESTDDLRYARNGIVATNPTTFTNMKRAYR